jgi:uncharacterized membrane protein YoaK (UPF0700 family)
VANIDAHERNLPAREHRSAARLADLRLTAPAVRDLLLVGLAVCSGAVDAVSFLALARVFSAFMTGNIVFLALGFTGADGPNVLRVGAALTAFAAGVALAVKIVKPSKGSAVWPRRVSIALGVSGLAQTAFLAGWIATSGRPATGTGHLLIGVYALAMGVQTGAVQSLGLPGIFTTAATATLAGLASDFAGSPQSTHERSRLAGVLAGICVGAAAGTLLLMHARSYAPLLPLIGTVLVIIAASRLINPQR